jgi:hypothetical protein
MIYQESMMRKIFLTALGLFAICFSYANHYTPAWWGQNPYMAMNFWFYSAEVYGVQLVPGDEIGIFDGATVVGAAQLTQPIAAYEYGCVPVIVSMNGGSVPGSATSGHNAIFKVWKSSTQMEYTYPAMSVKFQYYLDSYNTTFSTLGSCLVDMLSYSTPTGMNAQVLTPPAGPSGGYVNNVSFPGTGFYLNQVWINAGGGGTLTAYSFNTPTLDYTFAATPPLYNLNYGWFIDKGNISYFATPTYPIAISFNLSSLSNLTNPATVLLYQRAIHGTGPFTAVPATYNASTGYLSANVTSLGEFILCSNDVSNSHGNLEGHVYQEGTTQPIASAEVTIGSRTILTDDTGYYHFTNHSTGEFTVMFEAAGYESTSHPVTILPNQTVTCDAYLELSGQEPTIPQLVTIARTSGGFDLTWQPSDFTLSYNIYACADPYGTFLPLVSTNLTNAFLSDAFLLSHGLDPQRAFFYVRADSEP